MSPLEKCLLRSCAHFSVELFGFLLLSCMTYLYILEIKCFSVASFANIFSHSGGCIFILFMVFFAVQKLVSLIEDQPVCTLAHTWYTVLTLLLPMLFYSGYMYHCWERMEHTQEWSKLRPNTQCFCSSIGGLNHPSGGSDSH